MYSWAYAPAGIGAALAFGLSTHLKYESANDVPNAQDLRPGSLARFTRATLAHRLWLGGIGADLLGLVLQLVALHLGPLAAVQPLLILALVFTLVLRQRRLRVWRRAELVWTLLVTCALGGLVWLAGTANGGSGPPADRGPAIVAAMAGAALAGVLLIAGRRGRKHTGVLIGIVVGGIYATNAALLKSLTHLAAHNAQAVLISWQLYAVLALGGVGLLLNQLAFQSAPLTATLPTISVVDPLLSIVIGVLILDEQIRRGLPATIGLTVLLGVLAVGVLQLSRRSQGGSGPVRWR